MADAWEYAGEEWTGDLDGEAKATGDVVRVSPDGSIEMTRRLPEAAGAILQWAELRGGTVSGEAA